MGLAENLPVYKESYNLFTLIIKYSRNIPRDLKLLLGSELKNNAINLILSIYKANVFKEQRGEHIENCLLYLKYIELVCRLLSDLKYFSVDSYANIILSTQSIGRQLTAWKNSIKKTEC